MIHHLIYKCPKCHNTLLVSNQMLHDLKCTEENPATYDNILSQKNKNDENISPNKSTIPPKGFIKSNKDGTSPDIKKNIKTDGDEEFFQSKYEEDGNIISKKNNYQEISEFDENEDDINSEQIKDIDNINNNKQEIGQNKNFMEPTIDIDQEQIIYTTAIPKEIIYEAPAKYDPNIIINQPIQEIVINTDGDLNDNIMNEFIQNTILNEGNNNMGMNLDNNIFNLNEISRYNYERGTDNYKNIINKDIDNLNNEINNIYIDSDIYPDDILKKTAEI